MIIEGRCGEAVSRMVINEEIPYPIEATNVTLQDTCF